MRTNRAAAWQPVSVVVLAVCVTTSLGAGQSSPAGNQTRPPTQATSDPPPKSDEPRQNPLPDPGSSTPDSQAGGSAGTGLWTVTVPNWIMAIFTVAVAVIAILQVLIHKEMHRATIAFERAYLSLSHKPPGLDVSTTTERSQDDPPDAPGNFRTIRLHVEVKNLGNTPARVTRTLFQLVFGSDSLPPVPEYAEQDAQNMSLLLLKGEPFTANGSFRLNDLRTWQPFLADKKRQLYAIGYVDYIDQFENRHRTGWARRYDQKNSPTNNLPYVTDVGYNYDRPRTPHEGSDWPADVKPPRWWKRTRARGAPTNRLI